MDYTEFSKLRDILLERAKIFFSKESRANCKYMVNAENRVDVLGSVFIKKEDLIDGMLPLPFGEILGRFDCSGLGLTTLKGSPTRVKYFFDCSNNKLSNLDYCPKWAKIPELLFFRCWRTDMNESQQSSSVSCLWLNGTNTSQNRHLLMPSATVC